MIYVRELDFSGLDDGGDGLSKAVHRMADAYMKPRRLLTVHDRANEAKEDYLARIPGSLYKLMKEDIAAVWGLLESPIEQVAIFQLASENYSNREGWPIYAKVARERGLHLHKHYPVQIIPQVAFGRYRVDFLFDLGGRGLFAIECDGADYHQDKEKDRARDHELRKDHGVMVFRIRGKDLWRSNETASAYADLIRSYLK